MLQAGNSDLEFALEAAGFRDPGLSKLRKLPGLTARAVRYLGLALYRLEHRYAVPESFEARPEWGCCGRCGSGSHISQRELIDGREVCLNCMTDEEYERYRPDG